MGTEYGTAAKGKLIVFEGLDGSGKATQAALLREALEERGTAVRQVSFPDYDSESSALVRMYLRGDFGTDPDAVNAYAASAFYAVDRYASFARDWGGFYRGGGVVIADRYTTSNAVHQCCKLKKRQWNGFLDWLFAFEYGLLGIPAPDLVLYLRTGAETSRRLLDGREASGTGGDIHERDLSYQRRSERAADYCAAKLNWRTVDCRGAETGALRSIDEIHREVLSLVLDSLSEK